MGSLLARRLRRDLLRLEERLSLADVARRLPALAHRLLPLSQIPPERALAPCLRDPSRGAEREKVGKDPDASAAIVDAQSVKATEEGAASNGYDAHKNDKDRKRHLLVYTLSLPLSVCVTPADVQDQA